MTGNLTSAVLPSFTRTCSYNALNERIADAGAARQYDANGNLSGLTYSSITWDAENRIKSFNYTGTPRRVEYDYDGMGRRVRIREMSSSTKTGEYLYVWDGFEICERRDSVVPTFPVSIYFPQGEKKFLSGTYLNYFYMRDRLGTLRGATADTGSAIFPMVLWALSNR